jgi:hypothetical protein
LNVRNYLRPGINCFIDLYDIKKLTKLPKFQNIVDRI